ncbi:MAG: hypothetical protein JO001_12590 [Alphaproteobacteria bacterium]|nr:hypothetical protein [Alphaproteobacteria bacterium]
MGYVAQEAGGQIREKAGALAAQVGEKAKGFVSNQVAGGADYLDQIGRSAAAAADTLEQNAPQLAGYVRDVANGVSDLSKTVRDQSPEVLLQTASNYVRQNPALALGAAVVCGFVVTRFLQGGTWSGSRSGHTPGMISQPAASAGTSDAF